MSFLRNRTVIGVLCILLSLVICFAVTPLFNRGLTQKTDIVRVAREIKAGEQITADMVQTVEVGAYNLPANIVHDEATAIGAYAAADLYVGDYILNTKLSPTPAAENAYLYNLDGSKQAISVSIKSFAKGLSGKLMSGDIVSVIVPDYMESGETLIPPELQYVEIITVTADSGTDANQPTSGGGGADTQDEDRELPSTVTFLVLPEQARVLAELEAEGKLHLALVYRGTPDNAAVFIAAQEAVIEELYPEPDEENEDGDPAEGNNGESEVTDPAAVPESEGPDDEL